MQTNNLKINRLATLALALVVAGAANATQYQVTNLGTLPGGTYTKATGINNLGHVVGYGDITGGNDRGFFWNSGSFTTIVPDGSGDVGGTQVARHSYAMGINDSDQVVGYRDHYYASAGFTVDRAFRWTPGQVPGNIPNFASAYPFENRAYDINNFGTVVGHSTGQGGSNNWQPFRYTTNSGTVWMGSLTGNNGSNCYGFGINESANIAGYGQTSPSLENRAYRSNGGALINMGGFPNPLIFEPPLESFGMDINDSNAVCGYYKVDFNTFRAFYKTAAGAYVDLGLLNGSNSADDSAMASAMNNLGDIVGDCEVGNAVHKAVLYEQSRGQGGWVDLNTKIAPNSGWTLEFATDINDKGQIVGYGKYNGLNRAFLLTEQATISGTLNLEDFGGNASGLNATFWVHDSTNGQVLDTEFVLLGAGGSYSFTTTAVGPNRYVTAKFWHWLGKQSAVVNLHDNVALNFTLKNGDIDTDNEVGIGDYAILSAKYGLSLGDFSFNPAADLNGDFTTDIADYAILSVNYGLVGDE